MEVEGAGDEGGDARRERSLARVRVDMTRMEDERCGGTGASLPSLASAAALLLVRSTDAGRV